MAAASSSVSPRARWIDSSVGTLSNRDRADPRVRTRSAPWSRSGASRVWRNGSRPGPGRTNRPAMKAEICFRHGRVDPQANPHEQPAQSRPGGGPRSGPGGSALPGSVGGPQPRRGRKRTPESMKKRLSAVEAEIATADPLKRVHLVQERFDLESAIEASESKVDLDQLEKDFVKSAAPYSERKGITYSAWRRSACPRTCWRRPGSAAGPADAPRLRSPAATAAGARRRWSPAGHGWRARGGA